MIAKVLIDNSSMEGLACEWGLSVYIEHEGHKLLLDAGAGGKFAENAEAMGVDLAEIEAAVLSHAHFDHADGMDTFFEKNKTAKFYLRSGSGENCYKQDTPTDIRYIGIKKGTLAAYSDRIVFVDGVLELMPGVWLMGHTTQGLDAMGRHAKMFREEEGGRVDDDFSHEQSLIIETGRGLVIMNSCSHGGADTILRETAAAFPGKQITALFGGLHLFESSEEEVRALAAGIREIGIDTIVTGHCTGDAAIMWLAEELGEDTVELTCAGKVFEF